MSARSGTWSRISKAATFDPRLSPAAFRVLAALGTYADEFGSCFPAVGTIGARLGLQRRQVQRHLRALETLGYVVTDHRMRIKGGGFAPNGYLLQFPVPPAWPDGAGPGADEGGRGCPSGQGAERTSGHGSANASNASSGAASSSTDVSSDAASTARASKTGKPMRHPKAGDASSEGTDDASSDAALTRPIELSQRERAQSRAHARARGPLRLGEVVERHLQSMAGNGGAFGNRPIRLEGASGSTPRHPGETEAEARAKDIDLNGWAAWIDSVAGSGKGWPALMAASDQGIKRGDDQWQAIVRMDALLKLARKRRDHRGVDRWLVDMMVRVGPGDEAPAAVAATA